MRIYQHYTKERIGDYPLYSANKLIKCLIKTHYGHHDEFNINNSYAYSIEYIPL